MQAVLIRGIDFESIEEVHEYLARELDFPSYYGMNLDALYDVLTDIPGDVQIYVDLRDMEDDELCDRLYRMVEVMTDAAGYNPHLEIIIEE